MVTVLLEPQDGRIARIRLEGDYFGQRDIQEAEERLTGCPLAAAALQEAAAALPLSEYISGMEPEELAALIREAAE